MSYYASLDAKIQKFMCNSSRDIIRYFSAVASEDPVFINTAITIQNVKCCMF